MKQITRNIDLNAGRDLLERVPRACIAFAHDNGPEAQPVAMVWHDNRYFVGLANTANHQLVSDQEVVLLVDEGVYFFDLRAIYIRGHVQPTQAPPDASNGYTWFDLLPLKTVAWDYGTLHEVDDER
ncbi:MAG: hypothetical protein ABI970_07790 [Chloroflexota bacterium]